MNIFTSSLWGVRVWIWIYLLLSVLFGLFIFIYWKREYFIKKYYQLRFPEKIIKVILHFDTGLYREYYRLIPDNNEFKIDRKTYRFDDKEILKNNTFYAIKKGDIEYIIIGNNKYKVNRMFGISDRYKRNEIEIHYLHNVPDPIDFNMKDKEIKLSSRNLAQYNENNLFVQLLTMNQQKMTSIMLMILMFINLSLSLFIVAKQMGWIK